MSYDIKEFLKNFFSSRLFVISALFILLFAILIGRVFTLQIVNGKEYQEKFALKIQQTLPVEAARGNIYDVNGKLLAYNKLAYSISIMDSGRYSENKEKNATLNQDLADIIHVLDKNGDTLTNNFKIDYNEQEDTFSFNVSGNALNSFRADVFNKKFDKLQYNEKFGFNEAEATADQIITYLRSNDNSKCFDIGDEYDNKTAYGIIVVRYDMKSYYFTRYQSTTIAEDVSDETVAYINEHLDDLTGVSVNEDTIRKYNYSEYFSPIIGYTGKISETEYDEYSKQDESYTKSDTVGKSGLEQYYESYLRGKNGEQKVFIDKVGRISEQISKTDPQAGNDLYLSIDADLQQATYLALEQEIASIVYSNIKKNEIPMNDVYFALINNSVVDLRHFSEADASENEKILYASFQSAQKRVLDEMKRQLTTTPQTLSEMSEESLDDFTRIISILRDEGILLSDQIDTEDATYQKWRDQKLSPKDYLTYCITNHWIDISQLEVDEQYADSNEIYQALCDYILDKIATDTEFSKIVYEYMINRGELSIKSLCIALFEQGMLDYDDNTVNNLKNGTLSTYNFLLEKIDNLEITPAQLALDPCTGSTVVTDTKTGAIKAMVSYPGYDNNKLANRVDAAYFASLISDKSNPMLNYATQEETAPGSTFKMVSATAGLAENIITTATDIRCTGVFHEVDNEPKCWIYPHGTHGNINVSEALRDSCNVFFYTIGYRLAQKDTNAYNDANGISYIQKYASLYGLNQKTGLEIDEHTSSMATEYPVMAAIGQSNNNYTTVALARYVTAVTTGKLYSYQLMNRIVDAEGNALESYKPEYTDISATLDREKWDAIHSGMRMVVENLDSFNGFDIEVAGKTGTAQQVKTRPNHALFVGYAPYNNPEITIATRIAFGYSSHNAATAARHVIAYYYGELTMDQLTNMKASDINGSSNNRITD